jgi:hypothetical protein
MKGGIAKSWGGRCLRSFILSVEIVATNRVDCCPRLVIQGIRIYTRWVVAERAIFMGED